MPSLSWWKTRHLSSRDVTKPTLLHPSSPSLRLYRPFFILASYPFLFLEDLPRFCRSTPGPLYFIIDQMNAFDKESPNRDAILDAKKNKLLHEVYEMSAQHYLITSASATYQITKQTQTNGLKLLMMRGMSKLSKPLMPFPFPIFIHFGFCRKR
jgi:hypothetical protein